MMNLGLVRSKMVSLRGVIFLALIVSFLLFAAPSLAQNITLTPAQGPVGTQVNLKGSIDIPDSPFSVHWNSTIGPKLVEGKTGAPLDHPLKFSVTFTIPEDHYGRHPLYIVPLGARDAIVAPAFYITPSLFLEPKTVIPGGTVTVTGKGFVANDTAKVTLDGQVIKDNILVNSLGSFTTQVTIPEATAGDHILRASSISTPEEEVPPLKLEVKPVIIITPSPAEIGKPITITGKGFGAERTVTVKYNGTTITTDPSPLKTNSLGTFTATFTLGMGTTLKPTITATDTAGNTATLDMTLFLERTPPPAPMPISPTSRINWYGGSQVTFTWTKVTDPSGVSYTLEVAKDLNFFPPYLRRSGLTEPEYKTKEKMPPGRYYWRVKAVDGAGNESPWVIAPHPFQVGFFPLWSLVLAGVIAAIISLWLIIRLIVGFFRWLKSMFYY